MIPRASSWCGSGVGGTLFFARFWRAEVWVVVGVALGATSSSAVIRARGQAAPPDRAEQDDHGLRRYRTLRRWHRLSDPPGHYGVVSESRFHLKEHPPPPDAKRLKCQSRSAELSRSISSAAEGRALGLLRSGYESSLDTAPDEGVP